MANFLYNKDMIVFDDVISICDHDKRKTMNKSGVYCLFHQIDSKKKKCLYIGASENICNRIQRFSNTNRMAKESIYLRAVVKAIPSSQLFVGISFFAIEQLAIKEHEFIKKMNPMLNCNFTVWRPYGFQYGRAN